MRSKIRQLQIERVPYTLVVGDKETADSSVSVRSRTDGDLGQMGIDELCQYVAPLVEQGKPQYIF